MSNPIKRWDERETWSAGQPGEPYPNERVSPERIEKFLDAYEALCREHRLTLSHGDSQGAFIIEEFDADNVGWVRAAHIGRSYVGETTPWRKPR